MLFYLVLASLALLLCFGGDTPSSNTNLELFDLFTDDFGWDEGADDEGEKMEMIQLENLGGEEGQPINDRYDVSHYNNYYTGQISLPPDETLNDEFESVKPAYESYKRELRRRGLSYYSPYRCSRYPLGLCLYKLNFGTNWVCASCTGTYSMWNCGTASDAGCSTTSCISLTQNTFPADGSGVVAYIGATDPGTTATAGSFSDYFSNSKPTSCPITYCHIAANESSATYTSYVSMTTSTGVLTMARSSNYKITVAVICGNKFDEKKFSFDVKTCLGDITTVTIPGTLQASQTFTIVSGQTPYFWFDAFSNSAAHCDMTYIASAVSQGTTPFPSFGSAAWNAGSSQFRIPVISSLAEVEGVYNFHLTGEAEGGAKDYTTSALTLTVQCGSSSAQITASTFSSTQTVEVGTSSAKFVIPEFSIVVAACFIQTYQIGSATDKTALPTGLSSNTVTVDASNNVNVVPSDINAVQDYTFYLWATAKGGEVVTQGPLTLQVRCINNVVTQSVTSSDFPSGATSVDVLLDQHTGTAGQYVITLQGFSTSKSMCLMQSYSLSPSAATDTAYGALSAPAFTVGDSTFSITIPSATLGSFSFSIFGYALGGAADSTAVLTANVVCGSETLSVSQASIEFSYDLAQSGVGTSSISVASAIQSLFSTNKAQCGIASWATFSDSGLSVSWSDPDIVLMNPSTPASTSLSVTDTAPFLKTLYLKAMTDGQISASIQVDVVVCGAEQLSLTNSTEEIDFWRNYDAAGSPYIISWATIQAYYTFTIGSSSSASCRTNVKAFFTDALCTTSFVNDHRVALIQTGSTFHIEVYPTSRFTELTLYMKEVTRGGHSAIKVFHFEVCGQESVQASPDLTVISRKWMQESGTNFAEIIPIEDIEPLFWSTSRLCPISTYSLHDKDAAGTYSDYSGFVFSLESNFSVSVSTIVRGIHWAYLKVATDLGTPKYMPLRATIYQITYNTSIMDINQPPFFDSAPPALTEISVKDLEEDFLLEIPLSEVHDSHSNFCAINLASPTLGSFFVSNNTNVTEPQTISLEEPPLSALSIEISSLILRVEVASADLKHLSGSHMISISLIDALQESRVYTIQLSVALPASFEAPKEEQELQEGSDFVVKAWINSISEFGLMTVKFNTIMETDGLNLTELNNTNIDMYLSPANNWHLEEGKDFSEDVLNFTWSVTAYEEDQLIIKLNFSAPAFISKLVKQDTVVMHIHTPDHFFMSREHLVDLHEDYRTLKAKVRKQLPDTSFTRGFKSVAESSKTTMKGAMIGSFTVNLILSGVLSLLLGMINSLQIIVHLPIMSMPIPANAMTMFLILFPIVTFDLLENYEAILGIEEEEEEEPEFDLKDYLPGQMVDLGFDSFDPVQLLGTLGVLTAFYFLKVGILGLVIFPVKNLSMKIKEAFDSMKNQLFFQEILMILIEGYLEFSIVIFMHFARPDTPRAMTFFMVAFLSILALGILPGALSWIVRQDHGRFDEQEFKIRWEALFRDLKTNDQAKRLYFLVFITRRLLFVALSFRMGAFPQVQVIGLNLLNLSLLIYQGYFKPILSRRRNFIEIVNECFICLCTFHLMTFTDYVEEVDAQFTMGWSLVVTVVLYLLFNMSYIIWAGGRVCALVAVKYLTILWRASKKLLRTRFSRRQIEEAEEFNELVRQISQQPVKLTASKILSSIKGSLRLRRSDLKSGEQDTEQNQNEIDLISLDQINDSQEAVRKPKKVEYKEPGFDFKNHPFFMKNPAFFEASLQSSRDTIERVELTNRQNKSPRFFGISKHIPRSKNKQEFSACQREQIELKEQKKKSGYRFIDNWTNRNKKPMPSRFESKSTSKLSSLIGSPEYRLGGSPTRSLRPSASSPNLNLKSSTRSKEEQALVLFKGRPKKKKRVGEIKLQYI